MFSIFGWCNTKGPTKLVASLVRSFEDIRKKIIQPKTYEEIRALMHEQPNEEISLSHP